MIVVDWDGLHVYSRSDFLLTSTSVEIHFQEKGTLHTKFSASFGNTEKVKFFSC